MSDNLDWHDLVKQLESNMTMEEMTRYRFDISLSIAIIRARNQTNLTPKQLSIAAGLKENAVARIENGSYLPSLKTLLKIATAMNKKLEVQFVDKIDESE